MQRLQGGGGITGCASGLAVVKEGQAAADHARKAKDYQSEIDKFHAARAGYLAELDDCYDNAAEALGEDSAKIFSAYKEILLDDGYFSEAFALVREEALCIEAAVEQKKKDAVEMFADSGDAYLIERAVDIENVCNELIARMSGAKTDFALGPHLGQDLIVFAHDLTPVDTVKMDKSILRGFVTEKGGLSSHTAILAKTLGIPAVVGLRGALEHVQAGDRVVLYGDEAEVVISPDSAEMRRYEEKANRAEAQYQKAT